MLSPLCSVFHRVFCYLADVPSRLTLPCIVRMSAHCVCVTQASQCAWSYVCLGRWVLLLSSGSRQAQSGQLTRGLQFLLPRSVSLGQISVSGILEHHNPCQWHQCELKAVRTQPIVKLARGAHCEVATPGVLLEVLYAGMCLPFIPGRCRFAVFQSVSWTSRCLWSLQCLGAGRWGWKSKMLVWPESGGDTRRSTNPLPFSPAARLRPGSQT